jgi:glycosyltransferase involved in cell wall biosynthesis
MSSAAAVAVADAETQPVARPAASAGAPLRLLTFSTLYPNAARPSHGIFVRNRLTHLVASGAAQSVVVAPVPWFPSRAPFFGEWARHAAAPAREQRDGLDVLHPRYLVIPKLGMTATPGLMARACLPVLRRLIAERGPFDAIDAHYAYPDGVAAVRMGRALGLPVVITARGTDVNLIPTHAGPRRMLQEAFAGAAALIAVSAALKEAMVALGAPDAKVTVLRNGVDTRAFVPPTDRAAARAALGLTGPTLISVGHLIERKGHHRTIEALAALPDMTLLLVGEGPERERLAALATRLGVAERVRLLGQRPHHELAGLYGAADAMVLASSREGWANVLLESMACGTPVVASNIWGNPEVVQTRAAGVIAAENTPAGIAVGVRDLLADPPDRAATRAYAEAFGWDETTEGQLRLFRRVAGR